MINSEQLRALFASKKLSATEQQILEFIANNTAEAVELRTTGIAQRCYTSPTTVVRTANKLGFDSSREMLYELERIGNAPRGIIPNGEGIYLRYDPDDLEALFSTLEKRGTIGLSGQGYSYLITRYLEKKLMAFGCTVVQQADLEPSTVLENFSSKVDSFLFVSKSGETRITRETAELCHKAGIPTIAMTGNAKSSLAQTCDALFIINDELPFDIENVEPNYFFGYCILAIEEILRIYQQRQKR